MGCWLAEGRGIIVDPHTVEVRAADGSLLRTLRARNILVATGSHAVKIPIPGAVSGGQLVWRHHVLRARREGGSGTVLGVAALGRIGASRF